MIFLCIIQLKNERFWILDELHGLFCWIIAKLDSYHKLFDFFFNSKKIKKRNVPIKLIHVRYCCFFLGLFLPPLLSFNPILNMSREKEPLIGSEYSMSKDVEVIILFLINFFLRRPFILSSEHQFLSHCRSLLLSPFSFLPTSFTGREPVWITRRLSFSLRKGKARSHFDDLAGCVMHTHGVNRDPVPPHHYRKTSASSRNFTSEYC